MQLANEIKCPIIFSGTKAAAEAFSGALAEAAGVKPKKLFALDSSAQFEAGRRLTSEGRLLLPRALRWDDPWNIAMTKVLLRYQWTPDVLAYTDQLCQQLYSMHCGVTSVQILLHTNTQKLALKNEAPVATLGHYLSVYRRDMKLLYRGLNAMRREAVDGEAQFEAAASRMAQMGGSPSTE
jgi:hypothetical protein